MSVNKVRLPVFSATIYIEDDKSLLLIDGRDELVHLTSLATIILLSCDSLEKQDASLKDLAISLSLPVEKINDDFEFLKSLLICTSENTLSYSSSQYPELSSRFSDINSLLSSVTQERYNIKVANSYFTIVSSDINLLNDITALFKPIQIKSCKPDFLVKITLLDNGKYQLESNGLVVIQDLIYDEVLPELIDRLQILSYQTTSYLCCFHGAAVEYLDTIILIPGESGKGKSTLCAEFLHFGGKVYSDEFIVLDEECNLLSINLPIAIKTGSWKHLESYYPELATLKAWKRLDGRHIKYVWPNTQDIANKESSKLKARVIFPHFDTDIDLDAYIDDLSVIDTISELTAGGYQIANDLNEKVIDKLLMYLQQCIREELHYSESKQAFQLLGY